MFKEMYELLDMVRDEFLENRIRFCFECNEVDRATLQIGPLWNPIVVITQKTSMKPGYLYWKESKKWFGKYITVLDAYTRIQCLVDIILDERK